MNISNIEKYNLSRSQWSMLIDEWVFNERDRMILKRRLLDGVRFEPLSEEFGISVKQVKNIVYKSLARLTKHL